jgi:hypothetical protein
MNSTEFIITPDQRLIRRDIQERTVEITQDTLNAIGTSAMRTLPNAFATNGAAGPLIWSVMIDGNMNAYWTARLSKITLRCPWRMHEGALVPVFNSQTDPIMAIDWHPPFAVWMTVIERANNHTFANAYLYSCYGAQFYRLPLPNTFEDGKLCLGRQENPAMGSSMQLLQRVTDNFASTPWNADLWNETEKTFQLFRFNPVGEKMVAAPLTVSWLSLCQPFTGAHTRFFYPL